MSKGIEWLRHEVEKMSNEIMLRDDKFVSGELEVLDDVSNLIHQMDRMVTEEEHAKILEENYHLKEQLDSDKKSKEEIMEEYGMTQFQWIQLVDRYKWTLQHEGYVVIKKTTIPKSAADLIERGKSKGTTLNYTIGYLTNWAWNRSPYREGAKWAIRNIRDFVLAWEYGYTVEEPKFHLKHRGNYIHSVNFEDKNRVGMIERNISITYTDKSSAYKFTKEEKNDLQKHFNLEVEEVEE